MGDQIKQNEMGWACGLYKGKKHTHRFRWGNLRERDHLEDQGIDGRFISIQILKKYDRRTWTGLIWLRIGTSGRLL